MLGRTRKAKLALTLAGAAAGRKLPLSPQAVGSLLTERLNASPQLKQVGDQLRRDLGGVGKAATGALVERRVSGLADRLEDRTRGLQDRLTGGRDEPADADEHDETDERAERDEDEVPEAHDTPAPKKKASGKQAPRRKAAAAAKPAKKAASGARRTASSAKKAGTAKSAGTRGGGRRG
ncbi:DNA primase [Streptomyces sp. WMMC500]|uniref:DNA primase n=1 Tax=Streptomyces sp. WMMC500 TaxID=3015154 RepID=UPI00248C1900|nr:DNA primase [Streptomyces sp. WMMC500]WBB62910.1 DNA primase [Streptomyces sp. WMMC500]